MAWNTTVGHYYRRVILGEDKKWWGVKTRVQEGYPRYSRDVIFSIPWSVPRTFIHLTIKYSCFVRWILFFFFMPLYNQIFVLLLTKCFLKPTKCFIKITKMFLNQTNLAAKYHCKKCFGNFSENSQTA